MSMTNRFHNKGWSLGSYTTALIAALIAVTFAISSGIDRQVQASYDRDDALLKSHYLLLDVASTTAPTSVPAVPVAVPVAARVYTLDAQGWSVVHDDPALTEYIDPVKGNDTAVGSQAAPFKTFAVALKHAKVNGSILIMRSTSLTENLLSITQPGLHIGAYGPSGPRPIWYLDASKANGVFHMRGFGQSATDIDFHQLNHAPGDVPFDVNAAAYIGLSIDADNVLVEGCRFRGFWKGVTAIGVSNPMIRRNCVVDSFTTGTGPSAGIYTDECDGLVITENFFYGNGWYTGDPTVVKQGLLQFNHGIYADDDLSTRYPTPRFKPVTITNNVFADSAGWAIEGRPGGLVQGNFFLDNGLAGGDAFLGGPTGSFVGNVITSAVDRPAPTVGRGTGLAVNSLNGSCTSNLFVNCPGGRGPALNVAAVTSNHYTFGTGSSATFSNNTVFNWNGFGFRSDVPRETVTLSQNTIQASAAAVDFVKSPTFWGSQANIYQSTAQSTPYRLFGGNVSPAAWLTDCGETAGSVVTPMVDTTRTMETFSKSTGLDGTGATWIRYAEAQRKDYWLPQFQAAAAVAYFQTAYAPKSRIALPATQLTPFRVKLPN